MDRAEAALLGPALSEALDGINADDRDTLLLLAWNDLSYPEVAEALEIPVGTVRSRISRARTAPPGSRNWANPRRALVAEVADGTVGR